MPRKEDVGLGFARPTNAEAPASNAPPRHQAPRHQAPGTKAPGAIGNVKMPNGNQQMRMQMQNANANAKRERKCRAQMRCSAKFPNHVPSTEDALQKRRESSANARSLVPKYRVR